MLNFRGFFNRSTRLAIAAAIVVSIAGQASLRAHAQESPPPGPATDRWEQAANGEHSFRELGKDFFVDLGVIPAEGAKLALFSRAAAEAAGLTAPEDIVKLEKLILEKFGVVLDPSGKSRRRMFATRYQDSEEKGAGEALGDGRLVWAGEIVFQKADGKWVYLDLTVKGVGQTPLAWFRHHLKSHRDGTLGADEAGHTFVQSEANLRNGIRGPRELAVMLLPGTRENADGTSVRRALSVRVGNQTRMAHLRYFADDPKRFVRILSYCVRRDLGLAPKAKVTPAHLNEYIYRLAKTLGEEAAHYLDQQTVHGALTLGNRTSGGETIDLGTFRYLDANHPGFAYMYEREKLGGKNGQTAQLSRYLRYLHTYLAKVGIKQGALISAQEASGIFLLRFENVLAKLTLRRLGLDKNEIERIPMKLSLELARAMNAVHNAEGSRSREGYRPEGDQTSTTTPAAFDGRKALGGLIQALRGDPATQAARIDALFTPDRDWASPPSPEAIAARDQLVRATRAVMKKIAPSSVTLDQWVAQAAALSARSRTAPGPYFFNGPEHIAYAKPLLDAMERGANFAETQALADAAIDRLVDQAPPRPPSATGVRAALARCLRRLLHW